MRPYLYFLGSVALVSVLSVYLVGEWRYERRPALVLLAALLLGLAVGALAWSVIELVR